MLKNSDMDHLKGFFLVCFAGTLWSFGALIIRYMIEARNYQWQYLFYRGLTIAIVLLFYLMAKEGKTFITSFRHSGASGLLGPAGLICVVFTMLILFSQNSTIAMPLRNVYLSILHGFIVGIGLILFATGPKFLPAAELTLLSMVEVIGDVLWVYLPIFGIQ